MEKESKFEKDDLGRMHCMIMPPSFYGLKKNQCQECRRIFSPWSGHFERYDYVNGCFYIMAAENGYCKECAERCSRHAVKPQRKEETYGGFVQKGWHDITFIQSEGSDYGVDPSYDPDCARVETMPQPVVPVRVRY